MEMYTSVLLTYEDDVPGVAVTRLINRASDLDRGIYIVELEA